jgi:hypothetical protein
VRTKFVRHQSQKRKKKEIKFFSSSSSEKILQGGVRLKVGGGKLTQICFFGIVILF